MNDAPLIKKNLKDWLDQLQQDSWQLELVISGVAIFLLNELTVWTDNLGYYYSINSAGDFSIGELMVIVCLVLIAAAYISIFNLLFHLLLRSIWIGAIGLRYVSGDIEYDNLNYTTRFKHYLERNVGEFDSFIERLERVCSIVFAFSFLIVFMLISVGMFIVFIGVYIKISTYLEFSRWLRAPIVLPLMVMGLIYLLDFLTFGWFKKWKYFSWIYYPFYRLFSWITLANFYRPLYYNLISNKYSRKVGYFFFPYLIILLLVFSGLYTKGHHYFDESVSNSYMNKSNYSNLRLGNNQEDCACSAEAIISKTVYSEPYVELFLTYTAQSDNPVLKYLYPDLEVIENNDDGIIGQFKKGFEDGALQEKVLNTSEHAEEYLQSVASIYTVYLNDSLQTDLDYVFHEHPTSQLKGLLTVLDIEQLEKGKHVIRIQKKQKLHRKDSIVISDAAIIPFFKQ